MNGNIICENKANFISNGKYYCEECFEKYIIPTIDDSIYENWDMNSPFIRPPSQKLFWKFISMIAYFNFKPICGDVDSDELRERRKVR